MLNITNDNWDMLPFGTLGRNCGRKKIQVPAIPQGIELPSNHNVIAYDTEKYATFSSICSAANAIGKTKQAVSGVARGDRPTTHGYFWSYI